jgi:hypothetical protein
MATGIGMGGWWKRIRLSGWTAWKKLWHPDEDEEEEEEKEGEG